MSAEFPTAAELRAAAAERSRPTNRVAATNRIAALLAERPRYVQDAAAAVTEQEAARAKARIAAVDADLKTWGYKASRGQVQAEA